MKAALLNLQDTEKGWSRTQPTIEATTQFLVVAKNPHGQL